MNKAARLEKIVSFDGQTCIVHTQRGQKAALDGYPGENQSVTHSLLVHSIDPCSLMCGIDPCSFLIRANEKRTYHYHVNIEPFTALSVRQTHAARQKTIDHQRLEISDGRWGREVRDAM